MKPALGLAAAALAFVLIATANSGGYRYGASDQAFYQPAIALAAHPELYPRDRVVLASQMRLWLGDDLIGGIARVTGMDLPPLFLGIYLLTLVTLFAAAVAFARALGMSPWAIAFFLALLTIRHRIAKTGANSLEGYMHPRMLAFALGLAALAALARRRVAWAIVAVLAAGVIHTTTALWFAGVVAAALVATPRWRAPILAVAVAGAATLAWALLAGPLAGRLVTMDAAWLAVLAEKDYLFPSAWPAYAWITNLLYPVVVYAIHRRRASRGALAPGESALVFGLLALVPLFLISVPIAAARLALAVQLQVNRVFWLLDAATMAYVAWWLVDDVLRSSRARLVATSLAVVLVVGRGYYVVAIEAGRPLFTYDLPPGDWTDTMRWLRQQPASWHVLADPGHAWKFGSSVRVAAFKDVLLEASKDSALSMYDRGVALRVAERTAVLADFDQLREADLRRLSDQYALDVLVDTTERSLEFPVIHRTPRFVVYRLR